MTVEQLIAVLWRRRWTFLATFLATLAAVAAVTFSLPKVYGTVTYLLVESEANPADDFAATQLSQTLIRTYAELLPTRGVAQSVTAELPYESTTDEVLGDVTITPVEESQLVEISAEGSTPARAQALAETYADVFVERAQALESGGGVRARVTVAAPPAIVEEPLRPQPGLYLLVGAVLAALAGAAAAVLRHRLDQRIEVDAAARAVLGLPVLGEVPKRSSQTLTAWLRADASEERGIAALRESFGLLITNLAFTNGGKVPGTLAVVSAEEREGKSMSAISVARAGVEQGLATLLVDVDLRRPSIAANLDLSEEEAQSGLSNLLVVPGPIQRVVRRPSRWYPDVVVAGPPPPNPAALLSLDAFSRFDEQAKSLYALVVYDTPPISFAADASLVAAEAEAVLLVVDAERTRRTSLLRAIDQLKRVDAKVLGVLLNRVGERPSSYYYEDADSRPSSPARAAPGNGAGSVTQRSSGVSSPD